MVLSSEFMLRGKSKYSEGRIVIGEGISSCGV